MAEAAAIASGHLEASTAALRSRMYFEPLEWPRLVELLENPLEILRPGEAINALRDVLRVLVDGCHVGAGRQAVEASCDILSGLGKRGNDLAQLCRAHRLEAGVQVLRHVVHGALESLSYLLSVPQDQCEFVAQLGGRRSGDGRRRRLCGSEEAWGHAFFLKDTQTAAASMQFMSPR